jgi:nitrous oxide reductase
MDESMNRFKFALVAGAVLALAAAAGAGNAAPMSTAANAVAQSAEEMSLTELVHRCHRVCSLGPAGWHKHVGPRCVRVRC